MIKFTLLAVLLLVSFISIITVTTTVSAIALTPQCIGGNSLCQIVETDFNGGAGAQYTLSGTNTYQDLSVYFPSGVSLTLTMSNGINIPTKLSLSGGEQVSLVIQDNCTIAKIDDGFNPTVPLRSLTLQSSTINAGADAIKFQISSSFVASGNTITSTTAGTALGVILAADAATVSITGNTITQSATSNQGVAVAVYPNSASITASSISITGNTIAVTASGSAASGVGLRVSSSDSASSPPLRVSGTSTITTNRINVTTLNTATSTFGIGADISIQGTSNTASTVTLSNNIIGVISNSATGRAEGLAVYATGAGGTTGTTTSGPVWYADSNNIYVTSNGGNAYGNIVRSATSGVSLNYVNTYVRAHTSAASGASAQVMYFDSSTSPNNFELRLHGVAGVITASGASSSAYVYTLPTANPLNEARIFIGSGAYTAASGFLSTSLPATSSSANSIVVFRCLTVGGVTQDATTVSGGTAPYVTFLACGTCAYNLDCNQNTTSLVVYNATAGTCRCGCNADSTQTAWLPLATQCSGALGTPTTTTTTTTAAPITTTPPPTTTLPNATAFLTLEDSGVSYDLVLGLTIMGIILGLIFLVVLLCCCCWYCRKRQQEKEQADADAKKAAGEEEETDQDENYYEKKDGNDNDRGGVGAVAKRGEEDDEEIAAGKGRRPAPPPPHEILELRRIKYQNVRDKRLIEAHEEEAAALEADGHHERAAALRQEIAEIRAGMKRRDAEEAKQRKAVAGNNNKSRSGGIAMPNDNNNDFDDGRDDDETQNGDPDIEVTTDGGSTARGVGNYYNNNRASAANPPNSSSKSRSLDHPEYRARIALIVGEDDPRLGSHARASSAHAPDYYAHASPDQEHFSGERPRLSRTSPFRFNSASNNNTPASSTARGLPTVFGNNNARIGSQPYATSRDSVGMVASNGGGSALHVIGMRDENDVPVLRSQSRPPTLLSAAAPPTATTSVSSTASRPRNVNVASSSAPFREEMAAIVVPEQQSRSLPEFRSQSQPLQEPPRSTSPLRATAARYIARERSAQSGGGGGGGPRDASIASSTFKGGSQSPYIPNNNNAPFGSQLSPDGGRAPTATTGLYSSQKGNNNNSKTVASEPFGDENNSYPDVTKRFGSNPTFGNTRPNGMYRDPKALQVRAGGPASRNDNWQLRP